MSSGKYHFFSQEKDAAAEDELKKKRIIRNPMPKLNPDRITGVRGVGILPDVFKGFKSKGERQKSIPQLNAELHH